MDRRKIGMCPFMHGGTHSLNCSKVPLQERSLPVQMLLIMPTRRVTAVIVKTSFLDFLSYQKAKNVTKETILTEKTMTETLYDICSYPEVNANSNYFAIFEKGHCYC